MCIMYIIFLRLRVHCLQVFVLLFALSDVWHSGGVWYRNIRPQNIRKCKD